MEPENANPEIAGSEQLSASENRSVQGEPQQATMGAAQKSHGPRTRQGKDISKRNSLNHGIFSKALLLTNESRAEFNSFLKRLRDHFKPEGAFEEFLVLKVAITIWRIRRLINEDRRQTQEYTAPALEGIFGGQRLSVDLLLRYESNLERTLDRTLNQLERAQRMRRGQPVLPPINLNVSED